MQTKKMYDIYKKTFWANTNAFRYCQACFEIAKRGMNVNEIAIFLGPGGVGLSLYSSHIAAMYGAANHKYFDPNVFYQDDELRKVIETLAGGMLFTGQERPTGTKNCMREDLLKKFATAEGIAGRLPYAILTKLIKLIGWKRIELNKLFKFADIDDSNFESIVRRCAVIKIKARFFDATYLKRYFKTDSHEQYGIFARDPDAGAFMTGDPGVAAGIIIQESFGFANSLQDIRTVMSNYARCGGDDGSTVKYIRTACSLPPEESTDAPLVAALEAEVAVGVGDAANDISLDVRHSIFTHYVKILLSQGKDSLVLSTFKRQGKPIQPKWTQDRMWEHLMKDTHFWSSYADDSKKTQIYPRVRCKKALKEAIGFDIANINDTNITLSEQYTCDTFNGWWMANEDNTTNCDLFKNVVERLCQRSKKRTGGVRHDEKMLIQERKAQFKSVTSLLEDVDKAAVLLQSSGVKRRRLSRKTSESVASQNAPDTGTSVQKEVLYMQKTPWRSRSYANPFALQSVSQSIQRALAPRTEDFDIKKAGFVIVIQIIDFLEPEDMELWSLQIETIRELAKNRDEICIAKLRCPFSIGKDLLMKVFNGSAWDTSKWDHAGTYLNEVVAAGRFFRWLAVEVMPSQVFEHLKSIEGVWPTAPLASHLWMAVEDHIGRTWISLFKDYNPTHLSFHFDGIRMHSDDVNGIVEKLRLVQQGVVEMEDASDNVSRLLRLSERHITNVTKFTVDIKCKTHLTLVEQLEVDACAKVTGQTDSRLLAEGNCIVLGFCRLLGLHCAGPVVWQQLDCGLTDEEIVQIKSRSYADCNAAFGLHLMGSVSIANSADSRWLIHTHAGGTPHCVACKFDGTGENATVWVGTKSFTMEWFVLEGILFQCVDKHLITYFVLSDEASEPIANVQSIDLLQLRAGGGDLPASCSESESVHDSDDEAVVHVDPDLKDRLKHEWDTLSNEVLSGWKSRRSDTRTGKVARCFAWTCPFCPWYTSHRVQYAKAHLERHGDQDYFILSGLKQLKAAKALYDNDTMHSKLARDYLRRSAKIVNVTKPAGICIDRDIVLVLDPQGPRYVGRDALQPARPLRRVGYTYYNRAFANALVSNAMYVDGRISQLRDLFIRECRNYNGEVWSLIPRNLLTWEKLCEDVFFSPPMISLESSLVNECFEHDEFIFISMDGTVRVAFNIRGQARYRASKAVRADAAITDSEALRRVLAVRGRTGAVLFLDLVKSEDSDVVRDALVAKLQVAHRQQTVAIATDNPSRKLFAALLIAFSNLIYLVLDSFTW